MSFSQSVTHSDRWLKNMAEADADSEPDTGVMSNREDGEEVDILVAAADFPAFKMMVEAFHEILEASHRCHRCHRWMLARGMLEEDEEESG